MVLYVIREQYKTGVCALPCQMVQRNITRSKCCPPSGHSSISLLPLVARQQFLRWLRIARTFYQPTLPSVRAICKKDTEVVTRYRLSGGMTTIL